MHGDLAHLGLRFLQPSGELVGVLGCWHEDSDLDHIDMWEVAEFELRADPEWLLTVLTELDAFLAATTPEERYDELDRLTAERLPFRFENLDPFLAALRQRLVDGLESDDPAPLVSPPELLPPRDRREGPFPELLRLARYVHEHVSGVRSNPFLSEQRNADCVAVTVMRLDDLDRVYSERLAREITRLRAGSVRDWFAAVGGSELWDGENSADDWVDLVEFLARYQLQVGRWPEELTDEALAELRENAAVWPPIEEGWSSTKALLGCWTDDDPSAEVDDRVAKLEPHELRSVLEDVDLLLAAADDVRERILDLVVLQRPRQPKTRDFLADVRSSLVAALDA